MFRSVAPTGRPEGPAWSTLKVPGGRAYRMWLAGSCIGVMVHHIEHSKPCKKILTDGVLSCDWCQLGYVPAWLGYVPLYSPDLYRFIATVKEENLESLGRIKLHEPVSVSRGKGFHDPIRVTKKAWATQPADLPDSMIRPADIRGALLRIWKDEALKKWVAATPTGFTLPPIESAAAPARPLLSPGDSMGERFRKQNEIIRQGNEQDEQQRAKKLEQVRDELGAMPPEPKRNGRGKH